MSDILHDAGEILRHRDLSGCHTCCGIAAVEDGSGEDPGAVLSLVLKRHRLSNALTGSSSDDQDTCWALICLACSQDPQFSAFTRKVRKFIEQKVKRDH